MATHLSLFFFSKFEKPICRSGDCYSVLKPSASTRSGSRRDEVRASSAGPAAHFLQALETQVSFTPGAF